MIRIIIYIIKVLIQELENLMGIKLFTKYSFWESKLRKCYIILRSTLEL